MSQYDAQEFVSYTPRWMPPTFWGDLIRSQQFTSAAAGAGQERSIRVQSSQFWAALVRSQRPADVQSPQFWGALVDSQQPAGADESSDESYATWLTSDRPAGRIGFTGDALEWSPHSFEPVRSAAEPLEVEASARRDDVEWSAPATASEEWASARSEGLSYERVASEPTPSFVIQRPASARKTPTVRTAKRDGAKKRVVKKVTVRVAKAKKATAAKSKKSAVKSKKPAAKKTVARKFVAKKLVKKTTPAPRITKAPTRRAA